MRKLNMLCLSKLVIIVMHKKQKKTDESFKISLEINFELIKFVKNESYLPLTKSNRILNVWLSSIYYDFQ